MISVNLPWDDDDGDNPDVDDKFGDDDDEDDEGDEDNEDDDKGDDDEDDEDVGDEDDVNQKTKQEQVVAQLRPFSEIGRYEEEDIHEDYTFSFLVFCFSFFLHFYFFSSSGLNFVPSRESDDIKYEEESGKLQ